MSIYHNGQKIAGYTSGRNSAILSNVTLENQRLYDGLIKKYIGTQISNATKSSLKSVSINGNTLKFYTEAKPSTESVAAFTIELPETDLSDFMHLIKNATAGDVVIANADGSVADGGIKLADLAKSADVTKEIGDAKTELNKKVEANTTAIAKLNGAEDAEGSVAKAVKDAKDALQTQITANKKVLDKLDGADTVNGSVKKQVKDSIAFSIGKIVLNDCDKSYASSFCSAISSSICKKFTFFSIHFNNIFPIK